MTTAMVRPPSADLRRVRRGTAIRPGPLAAAALVAGLVLAGCADGSAVRRAWLDAVALDGDEFMALREGMTYDEVVDVVGGPGVLVESGEGSDAYEWNDGGAAVVLKDGRLVWKGRKRPSAEAVRQDLVDDWEQLDLGPLDH